MSQQEFEPGSQSNQQNSLNENDEIYRPQYPYSWSGKLDQEGVPRDEPPSSYDATMLNQGYQAQTSRNAGLPGSSQPRVDSQYQNVPPGGDGDAYEQGYRPYNTYNAAHSGQGVPPWARPQPHPRNPLRFGIIILIIMGISLFGGIFGHMGPVMGLVGGAFGALITLVLFAILVPLLILSVVLGVIFRTFGRTFRPRRFRYWRRGPWWF